MPDRVAAPVTDCGDQLRRMIAARRRRRRQLLIASVSGSVAAALAASGLRPPPVLFVWNASPSAPVGLYRLHRDRAVRRGDMVVAWIPEPARTLAARRRYLPANVPIVKRVAGVGGDRVCAAGAAISINGRRAATRRRMDPAGRPMPWWSGCRRLKANEYFLLTDSPLSFDGRYFGTSRSSDILAPARFLWAR